MNDIDISKLSSLELLDIYNKLDSFIEYLNKEIKDNQVGDSNE
jgi:hypothetical protein